MKCTFCGEEIPAGAKFCPNCGTPVTTQENEESREESYQDNNASGEKNEPTMEYDYSYGQSSGNNQTYESGQTNGSSYYNYGQSNWNQGNESGQTSGTQGYEYGSSAGNDSMNYQQPYGTNYQQSNGMNYQQSNGMNYQQTNGQQGGTGKPINGTPYLVFSILTTLCCCLPLGIAAIVFSSKINSLQNSGDYAGAQAAAKKAKILCIVGAVGGLIASIGMGVAGTLGSGSLSGFETVTEEIVDDDEDDTYVGDTTVNKTNEVIEGSWNEFSILIDGKSLTFPCSSNDIVALGLELDDEDEVVNKDVNAGEYELVFYENESDDYLMFMMCNDTDDTLKVLDCKVKGVYVADYNIENGMSVVFPGGVEIGTEISVAIEKWGEPDDKYEGDETDSYSWYDNDYNYCTLSVDKETGKIECIDLDGSAL